MLPAEKIVIKVKFKVYKVVCGKYSKKLALFIF